MKTKKRFRASKNIRECQKAFETALPRIVKHCQVQFRNVKCHSAREELIAEASGLAWKWFARLHEKGRDPTRFISAIATFAVKAARSGRRVAGMDRSKDVMSPRAQQRKGFCVSKLPDFSTLSGNPIEDALHDNTKTPVDDQVAFRFDFPAWLATFDEFHRTILSLMMDGERTTDIAAKVGKSMGRISQLRQEFSFSWEVFCEEEL